MDCPNPGNFGIFHQDAKEREWPEIEGWMLPINALEMEIYAIAKKSLLSKFFRKEGPIHHMNKLFKIILTAVASILIIEMGLRAETVTYISQTLNFANFTTGSSTFSFNRIDSAVAATAPFTLENVASVDFEVNLGYNRGSYNFDNSDGKSFITVGIEHISRYWLTSPSTGFPFTGNFHPEKIYDFTDSYSTFLTMGYEYFESDIRGIGIGSPGPVAGQQGSYHDFDFFLGTGTFDIVLNGFQSFNVTANSGNLPVSYSAPKFYGDMTITYGLLGVPEPSALSLLAIGLGLVLRRSRRTI